MTQLKLSPAPWKIIYNTDYYVEVEPEDIKNRYIERIEDANGETVVYTEGGYFRMSEKDANLIVNTRETLEALKNLLSRSKSLDQSTTHDGLENCKAIANARGVIAKIEGYL